MVKLRLQASRRLQEWLDRYAMTPRGRAVGHQYVRCGLAAEQDVQLREPEAERVVLVDERHANVVNQGVGESRRQLQAPETGPKDHDVLLHWQQTITQRRVSSGGQTGQPLASARGLSPR